MAAADDRPPAARGLTSEAASARLLRDGPNELPRARRRSSLRRLFDQMTHFFALMLWIAAALGFVADLPELGIAIVIVIVVNALFAFAQESRADHAAERLRALLPRRITAVRDGRRVQIDAREIVVGDLLALGSGDRIPADLETIAAYGLVVDTSLLTGESEPSFVDAGPLYAGIFVVEGEADAVVTATGTATRLAEIARMTTQTPAPASPLTLELHRVVRTIATIAVGVGVGFFSLALLIGESASTGLVFAIGVTVALVPEALLPTVTLSLAWGAERMARRQVLVRHLDAVETLGSTTFVCTDKTGTLTRNQMTVVEVWTPAGIARVDGVGYEPTATITTTGDGVADALRRAARAGVRCSAGYAFVEDGEWRAHGDPTEAAIDVLARRTGIDTDTDRATTRAERRFPFDPRRRRMSVVMDGEVVVKGAPDAVLGRCVDAEVARPDLERLTEQGLRVLAVAVRPLGDEFPASADAAEADLHLVGLVAMHDPPRDDVREAIESCRRAGIKVAMVTGDHPATATAIATETGLRRPDDLVVIGADLPDDDAVLGALIDRDGIVVARVAPEDKLRIARALRARGHVVAMTGDGVNDGPALHEATIGIAMGASGTDVAREAADLVLLDDHFASIVAGIEQGRSTFLNVRRFLAYHLTDNVAELTPFVVWALSGGRFPLALGVLQVLALDIGTDTLSAVALGAEPPGRHVLDGPPVSGRLLNATVARRAFGVLGPTIAVGSMAAFLVSFGVAGWRPGDPFPGGTVLTAASGAAFMAVVIAQSANAFACRSFSRRPGQLGWWTNPLLPPAVAAGVVVSLLMLFVGPVADELGQSDPPAAGWAVGVATAGVLLAVDAFDKRRRRQRLGTATPGGGRARVGRDGVGRDDVGGITRPRGP